MSYTVFIQKFKNQEPNLIDFKKLLAIVSDFGTIESKEYGHEIVPKDESMFEYASLMGESDNQFSGISFHRPNFNASFKQLVFQLLELNGTCFFDQNMECVLVRGIAEKELPEDIIENADRGIVQISSAEEISLVTE